MRAARQRGVRVTLDGQGGDEILAGYHSNFDYFWGGMFQRGALLNMKAEWNAYHHRFGSGYPAMAARTLAPFFRPQ